MKLLRRIYLVLAAALVLALIPGAAFANFGIHGGYVADTDACAGCHRAHTATSMITWTDSSNVDHNALLVGPPTDQLYIFCYVCHSAGAPGASTNVETGIFDASVPGQVTESQTGGNLNGGGFSSFMGNAATSYHQYDGNSWVAWGQGTTEANTLIKMDCGSCHDPHGSSNYRILKDYVNGHDVGGYLGNFASDPDPDPVPYVISNEDGFPVAGSTDPLLGTPAPTDGFRLHRQYPNYKPNYTTARYAIGRDPVSTSQNPNLGMAGWCTACHENYLAKVSIAAATQGNGSAQSAGSDWGATRSTPVVAILSADITAGDMSITVNDSSKFPSSGYIQIGTEVIEYSSNAGNTFTVAMRGANNTIAQDHTAGSLVYAAYNASDGLNQVARHRHPINVPMANFLGPRALTFNPFTFAANYPGGTTFVDIPLAHDVSSESGPLANQDYHASDWIDCLTCHRAHGVSSQMSGYAKAGLAPQAFPGGWGSWLVPDPNDQSGVPPATNNGASALLRADNRGVCERCHNK